MAEKIETKSKGLRQLTKPHSKPIKLTKGGKELVRDSSKHRKYKVKGE